MVLHALCLEKVCPNAKTSLVTHACRKLRLTGVSMVIQTCFSAYEHVNGGTHEQFNCILEKLLWEYIFFVANLDLYGYFDLT